MKESALANLIEGVRSALSWAPSWLVGLIVLTGSALVALLLHLWALRLLTRVAARLGALPPMLVSRFRKPVAMTLMIGVVGAALPVSGLSDAIVTFITHVLLVMLVLALGWGANNALALASLIYLRRFRLDAADNLLARKHITQVRILERTGQTLITIIAVSTALMTISTVRQFGLSLFASAGAAGLVVGLAARPVLSNLLAGIQIAVTQPIRVEDAVVVEGEWGWIETIASTYVVVRIWDLRRLILPLTYFIEKPFQNWTYESGNLLGAVVLHVDYCVPVDRVRAKLIEVAQASDLWDGKIAALQVTDTPNNMVELRALISARDSSATWDLRCEVREKLIAYLQQEYPEALPRLRNEVSGPMTNRDLVAPRDTTPAPKDKAAA